LHGARVYRELLDTDGFVDYFRLPRRSTSSSA
jgi:hypothetical protein